MTEKEKMLAGEIYDCGDPELIRRWHYAKELPSNCLAVGNPCRIIREV